MRQSRLWNLWNVRSSKCLQTLFCLGYSIEINPVEKSDDLKTCRLEFLFNKRNKIGVTHLQLYKLILTFGLVPIVYSRIDTQMSLFAPSHKVNGLEGRTKIWRYMHNCSIHFETFKGNKSIKLRTNSVANLPLKKICKISRFSSKTKLHLQKK